MTKVKQQRRFRCVVGMKSKQCSFQEFERDFVNSRVGRGVSKATLSAYNDNFKRLYEYAWYTRGVGFGEAENIRNIDLSVSMLGGTDFLSNYRRYLMDVRKLSIYTVENALRHYRAIAYYAMELGLIESQKIKLKVTDPPIKDTFTAAELERLAIKPLMEDFISYRTWAMIHYLSSTANRISSLLGLNVGDIDFENNAIVVRVQKNKSPRHKPLLTPLARVLREFIYEYRCGNDGQPLYDEPLFCSRFGTRLDYSSAHSAFEEYFAERKVEFNGFHKFRHSYAATWIRQGGNPFLLKEQLDHRTLVQTNRYANLYSMATREEAEKFSLSKKLMPKEGRTAL